MHGLSAGPCSSCPQAGFNSLYYALNPEYIPYVDPCVFLPQDFMHLELDGLLRMELAYLVFSLVRVHEFCTLDDINTAIQSYSWPPGHKPPLLSDVLTKGTKDGQPKSGAVSGVSASQQLHIALHRCAALPPAGLW